jgi:hypothetical protein
MPIGGESSDTTRLIVALATLIMATANVSMAPAVAFAAWALQSSLTLWCRQYGEIHLGGEGSYEIDPYAHYDGDFLFPDTPQTLAGAYSVSYYPAITQIVRDPRYTLSLHQIDIKVPARAEGHFVPSSRSSMDTISEYCDSKHKHRFSFSDTLSRRNLKGVIGVEKLRLSPSDVGFVGAEVTLTGA